MASPSRPPGICTKPSRASRSNRATKTFLLEAEATLLRFSFKQFRKYCIIRQMKAKAPEVPALSGGVRAFLDFCRVEKGLAANSISSYTADLKRFNAELPVSDRDATPEHLSAYVQTLYAASMSPRSIARNIATLRNFYSFLAREGVVDRNPAEF